MASLQWLAGVLLVPPVNLAVLAFVALLLGRRRMAAAALALLLLLALPAVSGALLAGLESPPVAAGAAAPAAIIILGGDVAEVDERPEGADVGLLTLERLRSGAALSRATGLPILVTGGVVSYGQPPVAVLMAQSLAADFGVTPRWVEPASRDTLDNARLSAAMLRRDNIGAAYVVTHAWHMRRALLAFAHTGFSVTPAPLPADRPIWRDARAYVPRVASWLRSYYALHEWIGGAWYAWRP